MVVVGGQGHDHLGVRDVGLAEGWKTFKYKYIVRSIGRGCSVGTFTRTLRLDSIDGERSLEVDAMVDTGASYTIVPAKLLRGLGVEPIDSIRLSLADGRAVEYDMGQAVATVDQRTVPTLVVFGSDDACPLLGAYTLEGLRLAVDPVHQRLVKATGFA